MNNLKKILKKEKIFFLRYFKRKKNYSSILKKKYKKETVYERKLRISYEVSRMLKNKVMHGPYKGMKILTQNKKNFVDDGAYCLGLYERLIVEILINQKFFLTDFVQIGAHFGYHVIGLIKNKFYNSAICFEKDKNYKKVLENNIKINKCQNKIKVFGNATENFHLEIKRKKKTLILIDIEGEEFKILNLSSIIQIKDCHLIIEIHHFKNNFFVNYKKLLKILLKYYKIKFITWPSGENIINEFPELDSYTDDNRYLICSEHRNHKMRYLYCVPNYM
jgi:hypothetical protein